MEEEIVRKLRKALSGPVKEEKDVVYIMVEIRKLLERSDNKSNYPLLNFYCNWALHTEISRISPARQILEKIEKAISSGKYDPFPVEEFISFEDFRKEIKSFLTEYSLPRDLFDFANEKWINFRKIFIDILIDCPLTLTNYKMIKEFHFIKSSIENDIDFIITFKNGKQLKGSFSLINF